MNSRTPCLLFLSALLLACSEPDEFAAAARGRGLRVAVLTDRAKARVYEATLSSAFRLEPALILMLDTVFLPRSSGVVGGTTLPASLKTAIRARGVVRGTCPLPQSEDRQTPTCPAEAPGYIVRFSEVFRISPDTVQAHLLAVRFQTPASGPLEYLRFEKAYRVVGSGDSWRVVAEGRIASREKR
jgi:hypothetical protein